MKAKMGSGGTASLILNLSARYREVVSVTLLPLCSWRRTLMHSSGGWVGPRAGMDVFEDDNILLP